MSLSVPLEKEAALQGPLGDPFLTWEGESGAHQPTEQTPIGKECTCSYSK